MIPVFMIHYVSKTTTIMVDTGQVNPYNFNDVLIQNNKLL